MKTIIYSPFDCLLKTRADEYCIEQNKPLSLNETLENVFVYPIGKAKVMPFVITQNTSPFYKIIRKNEQTHIFFIDGFYCKTTEKHYFSYSGHSSNVEITTDKIIFSNKTIKKTITLPDAPQNIVCKNTYHINYVIFDCRDSAHIIFFNTINGKIRTYEGDKIVHDKNSIHIYNGGQKAILNIDKDGLREHEKNSRRKFNNPLSPAKNFMNYIKERDWISAKECLSPALQENQNENSLYEYFGDVSYVFPINYNHIFAISDKDAKIYTFEISNGKIEDINDE